MPDIGDLAKAIQLALTPVRLTSAAITATTVAALLVCVVIAGLFGEVMLNTQLKWIISASFAGAMLALMAGLTLFLRELHLAMRTVRIRGRPRLAHNPKPDPIPTLR
jgi:Protein of unknown function (DUF2721)